MTETFAQGLAASLRGAAHAYAAGDQVAPCAVLWADPERQWAGVLRAKPNIKWDKDRGKEPTRPKAEYPWFWGWDESAQNFAGVGKEPDGNRWNDCHFSNAFKRGKRAG